MVVAGGDFLSKVEDFWFADIISHFFVIFIRNDILAYNFFNLRDVSYIMTHGPL